MLHCTTGNGTISAYGTGFESYRPDSESCKAKRNRQAAGLLLKRYSASAVAWNWGGPPQKSIASHAPGRNALILVRLWNAQNTGVMDSNNRWRFHARVDITFAATRSVDSLSDGGSSARERW